MDDKIQLSELENATIEAVRQQLDRFDQMFTQKEQGDNGVPTAEEIEQMWEEMLSKTKEIYASHISERLNNVNEKPLIERKKEST